MDTPTSAQETPASQDSKPQSSPIASTVQVPAPDQPVTPAQSTNPPSQPKKGSGKLLVSIGVLLIVLVSIAVGFVFGKGGVPISFPKSEKKEAAVTTPKPTVGTQMVLATPAFGLTSTGFQEMLSYNCKKIGEGEYQMAASALPLLFDEKRMNKEVQDPVRCRYNDKTNSWWLEVALLNGTGKKEQVDIYDKVSVMPDLHGSMPFTLKEPLRYSAGITFAVYPGIGDYVPPIEQLEVNSRLVREVKVSPLESIYLRTFTIVIPMGDERLIELLSKYKSAEPTGPGMKAHIDTSQYENIKNDIQLTFFSDLSALKEPEKTMFYNSVSILEGFTLKN